MHRKSEAKRENRTSFTQKINKSQSTGSPIDQILFLQRTSGNRAVSRLVVSRNLLLGTGKGNRYQLVHDMTARILMRTQKQQGVTSDPIVDIENIELGKGTDATEAAAKAGKHKQTEKYHKVLVVRGANKITAPSPLMDIKPNKKGIKWSETKTAEWAAITDPRLVDSFPNNQWRNGSHSILEL